MSQDWWPDVYSLTANPAHTIMERMELMFATLKSTFSDTGEPSSPEAGMRWYDETQEILKHRNSANNDWHGVLTGSASLKVWLYLNDAEEGWVIDGSVVDTVLALKGGSQAYNVSGGGTAGVWSNAHTHTDGSFLVNTYHRHNIGAGGGSFYYPLGLFPKYTDYQGSTTTSVTGTSDSFDLGATIRPQAAVGTLQYPDV